MKITEMFSGALMGATLVQCGFFESVQDALFGFGRMKFVSDRLPPASGAGLINSLVMEGGDKLGEIPSGTFELWDTVLREVPDGAAQLKDGIFKELEKKYPSSCGHGKKKHHRKPKHHKPCKKSRAEFLTVMDEKFPEHALRVTSPKDLGIDDVKQHSGYLDVEAEDKHFFFWFFESRNDPKNDPVVLWLNGGPGCSSLTGLFFELGPASIGKDLKPKRNQYSWNNNANVIFLDQPVNTGYSHSSGSVSNTVTAGQDTYAFLELFFKQFPEYSNRDFHIAGESYAGHYIPVFASEILAHNDRHFNLTSLLIGNGLTDPLHQYDLYEPMACGKGGQESVLPEEECQQMIDSQPRCNQMIQACYSTQSAWTCVPAAIYCNNAQIGPYQKTGLNVYDMREKCSGGDLCYPEMDYIAEYLNKPEVKNAVGAEVEKYDSCNFDVNRAFLFEGDWMKPYVNAVTALLEKEVPILIYAGDKDYICNWLGNEAWSRTLPWAGHEKFAAKELSPWMVKGKEAGQVRNYEHFTFLRVYEAGHMVPFNQPLNSLDMFERWISGDFTFA